MLMEKILSDSDLETTAAALVDESFQQDRKLRAAASMQEKGFSIERIAKLLEVGPNELYDAFGMERPWKPLKATGALRHVAAACIWHLADLKRAGHSRFQTELNNPPESTPYVSYASLRPSEHSFIGSAGDICAESSALAARKYKAKARRKLKAKKS